MTLKKPLSKFIDHTILKAYASEDDFLPIIKECKKYDFAMIAINSSPVAFCKSHLKDSDVHVGAAIGFPLGQTTIEVKAFESEEAIKAGADEIDYVINIGKVKDKDYAYIQKEMETIVSICRTHNVLCKVIFENCYLSDTEKIKMCEIASVVKPDFIKTSTGFGTSGATLEDVVLMRAHVDPQVQIKAAGGIRDLKSALAMIEAGAARIGTSSGVAIMESFFLEHPTDRS